MIIRLLMATLGVQESVRLGSPESSCLCKGASTRDGPPENAAVCQRDLCHWEEVCPR